MDSLCLCQRIRERVSVRVAALALLCGDPHLAGAGEGRVGMCVAWRQQSRGACEEGAAGGVGAGTAAAQARRPAAPRYAAQGSHGALPGHPRGGTGTLRRGLCALGLTGPREAGLEALVARMPTGMAFNPGPLGAALAGGNAAGSLSSSVPVLGASHISGCPFWKFSRTHRPGLGLWPSLLLCGCSSASFRGCGRRGLRLGDAGHPEGAR